MPTLNQTYFVIHRSNDPEVLIHGKEGPRLYLTQKNAERQAVHWNGYDDGYRKYPEPNEYLLGKIAEADRDGPWVVSKVMMALERCKCKTKS